MEGSDRRLGDGAGVELKLDMVGIGESAKLAVMAEEAIREALLDFINDLRAFIPLPYD